MRYLLKQQNNLSLSKKEVKQKYLQKEFFCFSRL